MDEDGWGIGSAGPIEDAYLKVMSIYFMELEYESHDTAIAKMAKMFAVDVQRMQNFVEKSYAKAQNDPDVNPKAELQPDEESKPRELSQMWNGYCPESHMNGKTVRMRLNRWDFYESEETGLQIMVLRGVMAVILNFRGNGEFRETVEYGDEAESGELLAPQVEDEFPFHGHKIFDNGKAIREYIIEIPKT